MTSSPPRIPSGIPRSTTTPGSSPTKVCAFSCICILIASIMRRGGNRAGARAEWCGPHHGRGHDRTAESCQDKSIHRHSLALQTQTADATHAQMACDSGWCGCGCCERVLLAGSSRRLQQRHPIGFDCRPLRLYPFASLALFYC